MEALAGPRRRGTGGAKGRALVFTGFMGAGKSSAARAAAERLGIEALDSDRELERELGEPLEQFFDREGEAAFREREEKVVVALLERPQAAAVALGGGALGSPAVRAALESHTVVYLDVDIEEAWARAAGSARPLARDRATFERLHAARAPVYESAADAVLSFAGRDAAIRALPALAVLRDHMAEGDRPAVRLLWASARSGDYPVFIGHGLLASGFSYPREGRRFLVTDENVAGHHDLPADARMAIPAGEGQKTLARAEAVLRAMADAGLARDDLVVALGGGVVGDLAGFCAAVYQRGIGCVQAPTTLVAQVDSAYGGKTGVDLPEAKNYVGAYRQPASVLVDPATLETLPTAERAAGYAEVVKTALIAGGRLWDDVRGGAAVDAGMIEACIRTKLAVVAGDERDDGRRQVLNLGHTVAHALEAATGYSRYRHGEAVAIGLLCALRLSGREELRAEVSELLRTQGLPVQFGGTDPDAVLARVRFDKKRRGGRVPFVLVEAPGRVTHGHEVAESDLRAAIEEVCAA